jgi:FlaA1/EpsC-like NDP-sugar epimerase
MGIGGEIYIFDMGKSIKIFNMAKRMISLSGLVYPDDIDIKITGLRPGEKLYEELLAAGENTVKTYHEKIMIAKSSNVDFFEVKKRIVKLTEENAILTNFTIVEAIKEIVPEYISNNSIYEKIDKKVF